MNTATKWGLIAFSIVLAIGTLVYACVSWYRAHKLAKRVEHTVDTAVADVVSFVNNSLALALDKAGLSPEKGPFKH